MELAADAFSFVINLLAVVLPPEQFVFWCVVCFVFPAHAPFLSHSEVGTDGAVLRQLLCDLFMVAPLPEQAF